MVTEANLMEFEDIDKDTFGGLDIDVNNEIDIMRD